MEDITQLKYPQDFSLNQCTLITSLNTPFDFRPAVMKLTLFQDIYSPVMTGNIIVTDSSGFINNMSFNGNEFITIKLGKPGNLNQDIDKTFRIFKVSDRKQTKNQNEMYMLHFCSEELLLSEQYKISKSYKGKKISDIVSDILTTYLKVNVTKFDPSNISDYIEETQGMYNFIVPNFKPFEALNWLTTYAISNDPKTTGSPYLFYETNSGFNFKSLQSMVQVEPSQILNYAVQNLNLPNDDTVTDMDYYTNHNVLSYEHVRNFDMLDSIMSGTFANKLVTVDPIDRIYNTTNFDYNQYIQTASILNSSGLLSNTQNRFLDTTNSTYDSVYKVMVTNTGQNKVSYIQTHQNDIKDINIEVSTPNRVSQISQLNTIKMKIVIPGNPTIDVGDVITFNFLEMNSDPTGRKNDRYYSGNYLVTAIRHKIDQEGGFLTLLEISKESMNNPYIDPNNTIPAWNKIRSA